MKKIKNDIFAARIITRHNDYEISRARKILLRVISNWPENKKVNFLITCGGFLTFEWPANLPKEIDKKNQTLK